MDAERLSCAYESGLSERFRMVGVPYANQYYTLSTEKLETLRPCFRDLIASRWPDVSLESGSQPATAGGYVYVQSIKDAKERNVIIGAIYKDMKLRPSPLEEYGDKVQVKQKLVAQYTSEDDRLFIEDQSIRTALRGDVLDVHKFVTGLIVALRGTINQLGEFEVDDYLMPGPPLALPFTPPPVEKYVALVSGLDIAGANANYGALMLLRDFILGNTPTGDLSRSVTRLVIAGNGIGKCDVSSLTECDVFFAQLASSIYVDLMPGDADPSNRNLPQQPIHPCFLEHSKRYSSFQSTTNPYFFSVDGVRFLGTSGQAVKGICDYSTLSELEALQLTVRARCMAPTAPDTLGCHPEARVFTLENDAEFPHVVFSGNAHAFASGDCGAPGSAPRAICVPSFQEQPSIVLVSLLTLQTRLIKIG